MRDDLKAANEHDYTRMLVNAARVIPDVKKAKLRMEQIAEANPEYAKGTDDEEFKVQSWPERKDEGGQRVGSGPCGVKVTHKTTGTHAACDLHRSQHKNRQAAMEAVTWMLNT